MIVSQYFWPENFRINDLAAELVRRGHQVTVLTGLPNYPAGRIFEAFRRNPENFRQYEGVEVVRVPLLPRGTGGLRLMLNYFSFALTAMVIGAWKLRGRKFDVVFTNQLSPVLVGLPGALMAWLKSAPMTMWILDLWPDSLEAVGVVKSRKILDWVGKLTAFIYSRCDVILVQSRSFMEKVAKLAGPAKRIEYIPSWAENVYQSKSVIPAPEVPSGNGLFSVMFAGNIGEAQDFPCILDAAELLRNQRHIRWLIVGDGRMSNWLREQIKTRGLENTVLLLGRHPVERMPSFFARADALLVTLSDQPIFAMTIPGKLQSYLAAGMPVVAALNGEGADVVRRGNAGLTCSAGDAQGLANAVLSLTHLSDEERRNMGQRALNLSQQEFDRDTIISQVEQVLHKITIQKNNPI